MASYIIKVAIVAALVIGITAVNGAIGDVIGRYIVRRQKTRYF